jgi:WD40 repeat protein
MNTILLPPHVTAGGGVLPACPYQGLMPYTEDDAEFFFGRDRDTRLIVDNLKAYRVTVLYGPSGVGKSSVLRAGVLQRMNEAERESLATFGLREAVVVYCNNWRDDPLTVLAKQIRADLSAAFPDRDVTIPDRLDAMSVAAVCESLDIDMYLVLDQFDEYFLYHGDEPSGGEFSTELAELIVSAGRVNLLIAIREDAFARLDRFEGHVPRLFDNTLRLDHLNHESARQAVLQPLVRYNELATAEDRMKIESELVDRVLDQIRAGRVRVGAGSKGGGTNTGSAGGEFRIEAPFLQLVLTRIWWEERGRFSSSLHAQTLTELGGAEAIVGDHLDVVLDDLGPADKALVAAAFRYLVTASGTKIAYTPNDLADSTGADKAAMRRLLELLSTGDQRILRDVGPPLDDRSQNHDNESRYELFHDVLALAALEWRRRYDAEQERHEAAEGLVREKEAADRAASDARRRLRRSRVISAALATLVVCCLILTFVTMTSNNTAQQKALLAESARLLSSDPQGAAATALKALRRDNSAEAQQALRAALSQPRPTLTLPGTGLGAAWWAEMSPQEDLIAVAYHDGTARLWDARTGDLRHVLEAGKASGMTATGAQFSEDGSFVVTSSDDGWARVFDTRDGSLMHELGPYENPVGVIAGMAAGRNIVLTWAQNEYPAVWDASSGRMLATLQVDVRALALSEDGTRVLIGSGDGRLQVWTWAGKQHVVVDAGGPYEDFLDANFSWRDPNIVLALDRGTGSLIQWNWQSEKPSRVLARNQFRDQPWGIIQAEGGSVALIAGKEVTILDSATGKIRQILPDSDDWVSMLAFSPDGHYVARGDNDGTIRVFSVQAGNRKSPPVWVLRGHTGAVQSLAFSRDGTTLISAATDGSVRLWRLPERLLAQGTNQSVSDARFSVDGRIIASGDSNEISTSDVQGGHPRSFAWPGGDTEQLLSLALSPDSSDVVAITSQSDTPRVFKLSNGEEKPISFNGQTTYYLSQVDYNPNPAHPWIAVGNYGGTVEMLDVTTGDLLWSQPASDTRYPVFDMQFSADGSKLATASTDGVVKIFDAASGRELRMIRHSTPVTTVALTTDSAYLATYAEDRKLRVWSMEDADNEPVAEVMVPVRGNRLAFSPDRSSKFLAVAGSDGSTMMYQWQKQLKPLATIRQHSGSVNAVEFDPKQPADGPPRLMSASDDGTVAIYSCELCSIGDDELEQYARAQLASR